MAQNIESRLETVYNKKFQTIDTRILEALQEGKLDFNALSLEEIRQVTATIIDLETKTLQDDVQTLLAQKEAIERELEKKSDALQNTKYTIFNVLEEKVIDSPSSLAKLHQVKLQSIDLYDILSEMVESALITALEKDTDGDITEATTEVIKEISFESIKEGSLNTIRVRKILSTILTTAIDIAEATPNRAEQILSSTLKGMRSGLIKSIDRFKKRLEFMPIEAKHILIEDYDTIIEDLNQTDTLFSQVVTTQAHESSAEIKNTLLKLNKDMAYDLRRVNSYL
ncbi:MAG: hypothetical protein Q9M40_10365 [Sulfurimonas sp.]|nr:hypothetical protein [Sulfurimonas sp.]